MNTKIDKNIKTRIPTKSITLCALFTAITAILSQIIIPIPLVPINLALISIFLAGGLLGPIYGTISQIIYVLLGCIGLPVFAGFKSGFGTIFGPTGGYIIGYVLATFVIGLILKLLKFNKYLKFKYIIIILSMIIGLIVCYTFGTIWFVVLTNRTLIEALNICIIPFLIGDALKIIISAFLTIKLKKHINID